MCATATSACYLPHTDFCDGSESRGLQLQSDNIAKEKRPFMYQVFIAPFLSHPSNHLLKPILCVCVRPCGLSHRVSFSLWVFLWVFLTT